MNRGERARAAAAALMLAGINVRGLLGEPASDEELRQAAEAAAAYEAERCPHCGCHPEEHEER
jgi:hypothetical protein